MLAAGALPSFVLQYRQRIVGRLDQLNLDLAPWKQIAERLHNDDLQALVNHHLSSGDSTFVAEAAAINAMQQQLSALQAAVNAMQGNVIQRVAGWLQHVNWQDTRATWSLFEPQFPLDPQGLLFALVAGGGIWLVVIALAWCATAISRRVVGTGVSHRTR